MSSLIIGTPRTSGSGIFENLKNNDNHHRMCRCTSLDYNDLVIQIKETPAKRNQSWIHPVFDLMRVGDIVEVRVQDLLCLFVKTETDLTREEEAHSPRSQKTRT